MYFFILHYQRQLRYFKSKKSFIFEYSPSAILKVLHFHEKAFKQATCAYFLDSWSQSYSQRNTRHKYIILNTTWPFKPFFVENHNLIKLLSSTINKFKNLIKYSKSKQQNYSKSNMIYVSHTKNIH